MELQELKKGQLGHGILIEQDGHISINEGNNKKIITEAFDTATGEWNIPNPFVLDVVLQKYGIKNANGRIYPENILKREVEKYQEKIRNHNALGECYTPDVLVLTINGWKPIQFITTDDVVLTLNTETSNMEFQKVTRKIERHYDGHMIHLKSPKIDDLVTPQHKFPIYRHTNEFYTNYTAEDLAAHKLNYQDKSYIPKLGFNTEKGISLKNIKFDKVPYDGMVYCLEVPNHTFYVKSMGYEHWSHNCDHPSDSTISLDRISHNILECHWEGHTLVGKLELNITEGYRRHGIASSLGDTIANLIINGYLIGISSRGVGSVEEKYGNSIVGDDFELLAFDIVSDPSTRMAYLKSTKEELAPFIESKNNGNSILSEKIDKINKILL